MIASVTCQDGVEPVLPGGWPYWITRISPGPESESSSLAYCAAHGSRTKPLTTSPAWDIKLGSYFFLRGCHVRLCIPTDTREDGGCRLSGNLSLASLEFPINPLSPLLPLPSFLWLHSNIRVSSHIAFINSESSLPPSLQLVNQPAFAALRKITIRSKAQPGTFDQVSYSLA